MAHRHRIPCWLGADATSQTKELVARKKWFTPFEVLVITSYSIHYTKLYELGGFYNLPHGVCNAILLPAVCEFNMIANPKRFADIAVAMGENIKNLSDVEAAAKGIAAIRKLSSDIGRNNFV